MITGGSRGIGRAVALRLAEHGARIVICAPNPESLDRAVAEIRAAGVEAWGFRADVSRVDDIEALAAQCHDATGGVDANFAKHFASYAASYKVTVNCVHPGYTATERVMQIFEREAMETRTDVETVVARRTGDIPLGRMIKPEDLASVVLLFCSPLASMVTGQCIAVDGGSGAAVVY